jgi:hypothetical protein
MEGGVMGHKDAEWLYDTPPADMQPGWYATVFSFGFQT